MTAALPEVVGGFSLLVFTTNWLPSVRLTGPLLNLTEIRYKGTSTECIKQKSIRKAKHSRAACFLVHVLLIHTALMLAALLRASLPFYLPLLLLFLPSSTTSFLPFPNYLVSMVPVSNQSEYCESWRFPCGWDCPSGYFTAKKSEGTTVIPYCRHTLFSIPGLSYSGNPRARHIASMENGCFSASQ